MPILDLEKYADTTSPSIRKKVLILQSYIKGLSTSKICKTYNTYSTSVNKLINAYKKADENAFLQSKIGRNLKPLLVRPLTPVEKKRLESEMNSTEDEHYKKRCLAVLKAKDFFSYRKLAATINLSDHKQAKMALQRYEEYGIEGLRKKRTGPMAKSASEVDTIISQYVKIGNNLWVKKGRKTWVTDTEIAKEAGVSEGSVQRLLRGRTYPWRRSSKITLNEISKIATELGQRIEGLDRDATIISNDRIVLTCNECSYKRKILVNTLKHDRPHCPICVKQMSKDNQNKTQSFIVNLISSILHTDFEEDITPPFLRKATGRNLRVDGYSGKEKIIIEYQGILHYSPASLPGLEDKKKAMQKHMETVKNDRIKRKACKDFGYTLIEVQEIKEATINHAIPAVMSAFSHAGLQVPTSDDIMNAYYNAPKLSVNKTSDRKRLNCIKRILSNKSTVQREATKLKLHKTTIYKWLKEHDLSKDRLDRV